MKMTDEDKMTLRDGLEWLIRVQEAEMERIHLKTEEEYSAAKALEAFMTEPFSLEREKEKDRAKVRAEIKRLHALSDMLNTNSNQILVVPDTIRLQLTAELK